MAQHTTPPTADDLDARIFRLEGALREALRQRDDLRRGRYNGAVLMSPEQLAERTRHTWMVRP
jgi:hypothetical protein